MIDLEALEPPRVQLSPDLEWVLLSAFGPSSAVPRPAEGGDSLWRLADRLGLAERIGARAKVETLAHGTGEPFHRSLLRSAATSLLYEGTAREIAALAAEASIPLAFLKGFALFLLEVGPPGSRPFADLDLLASHAGAEDLLELLIENGYEIATDARTDQHLPVVINPQGGAVEIHFALRGLGRQGRRETTLEELELRGDLSRIAGYPGECSVPTYRILAAHALVHGMRQHLLRPRTYPLFRMVADLVDLSPLAGGSRALEEPLDDRLVSPRTLGALRSLCASLTEGSIPARDAEDGAGLLLAHFLAGGLDEDYAASLASSHLRQRLQEARRQGEVVAYLRRKLLASGPLAPSGTTDGRPFSVIRRMVNGARRQGRAVRSKLKLRRRADDQPAMRSED